jgi:hypothetical protein
MSGAPFDPFQRSSSARSPTVPDPLLDLYEQWERADAEHNAAIVRHSDAEEPYFKARERGDPEAEALRLIAKTRGEESATACRRAAEISDLIIETPARDCSGLVVKLRVMQFYDDAYTFDGVIADAERIMRSTQP